MFGEFAVQRDKYRIYYMSGFMLYHWAKSKASNAFANVIIVEFVEHIIGLFVLTGGKRQYVAPASPAWTAIPRKPSRLTFRTLWDLNQADEWSTLQVAVIGKRWSVAGQEHGFDDRQFSPFGKARLKQRSNLWLDFCTFQSMESYSTQAKQCM